MGILRVISLAGFRPIVRVTASVITPFFILPTHVADEASNPSETLTTRSLTAEVYVTTPAITGTATNIRPLPVSKTGSWCWSRLPP